LLVGYFRGKYRRAPKTQELLANIAYFGRQSDEVENL
jgi:hypothetical protein